MLLTMPERAQMQVYAIATEDMDALTFATPRLIRHLCAAQSAKLPIEEYDYDKVLEGLKLTADQFVDLCILCGCDYCGSIKGQPLLACMLPPVAAATQQYIFAYISH